MQRRLVLASTSPYRRGLLERLHIPFEVTDPGVEEGPSLDEPAAGRAERLARAKAYAAAGRFGDAVIIGSDQVASCDGEVLDKPGSRDRAIEQLHRLSDRRASFHTAVAVHDARSGALSVRVVPCHVHYQALSEALIQAYIKSEQPYDCAGSTKIEGLGIALARRIESDDPTALIGLPLIALTELLRLHGIAVPPP